MGTTASAKHGKETKMINLIAYALWTMTKVTAAAFLGIVVLFTVGGGLIELLQWIFASDAGFFRKTFGVSVIIAFALTALGLFSYIMTPESVRSKNSDKLDKFNESFEQLLNWMKTSICESLTDNEKNASVLEVLKNEAARRIISIFKSSGFRNKIRLIAGLLALMTIVYLATTLLAIVVNWMVVGFGLLKFVGGMGGIIAIGVAFGTAFVNTILFVRDKWE